MAYYISMCKMECLWKTFMQDEAPSHIISPVKYFLIQTSGDGKIISRNCRFSFLPRSPYLKPASIYRDIRNTGYIDTVNPICRRTKDTIRRVGVMNTPPPATRYRCSICDSLLHVLPSVMMIIRKKMAL